ncbi:hypothetical protein ACIBEJ_23185 [Nonomuraea sp. NPDC050790]|uniref:hypothetical protein n=1 Tax=Nonomuraea sp. NPDC050790 TaxID=3364371 RepID=UPI00379476D4
MSDEMEWEERCVVYRRAKLALDRAGPGDEGRVGAVAPWPRDLADGRRPGAPAPASEGC